MDSKTRLSFEALLAGPSVPGHLQARCTDSWDVSYVQSVEKMRVRVRFWLEREGNPVLGSGRRGLPLMIAQMGSLGQPGKHLGMSYRSAWGKLRRTEDLLGWKLVEKRGSSMRLVLAPKAVDILRRYGQYEKEALREL